MLIRSEFYSAYTKLDGALNGLRVCENENEPMLSSILTFSKAFLTIREKMKNLPFSKISQHPGNQPFQFGGQLLAPKVSMPSMPMRATLLPPPWMFGKMMCQVPTQQQQPELHLDTSQQRQQNPEANTTSLMVDENVLEQNPQDSASEGSSALSSPPASNSPKDSGYYSAAPLPRFVNLFHHHPPPIMYPYNPFMSLSPTSMAPPPYPYMNGYAHNAVLNGFDYSEVNGKYDTNLEEDTLAEDMEKTLNLNDVDDMKRVDANNGNDSDSSGLSSASCDSITACSTVTPDCDDDCSSRSSHSNGEDDAQRDEDVNGLCD